MVFYAMLEQDWGAQEAGATKDRERRRVTMPQTPGLKAARAASAAMKRGPLPIIRKQWNMTGRCACGALMDRRSTRCAACYRKSQAERNRAAIGTAPAVSNPALAPVSAPPRDGVAAAVDSLNAAMIAGKAAFTDRFEIAKMPSGEYTARAVGGSVSSPGVRIVCRLYRRANGNWDEWWSHNDIMRVRHSGKPKEAAQESEQETETETEADPEPLSEEEIAAALA